MNFLLRKIKKSRWYKHDEVDWLGEGELQADALADLQSKGNELSFWVVDEDKSNLNQILAALGANCDYATNIDYALFNEACFKDLRINAKSVPGDSHDSTVNKFHLNAIELTANRIYKLALIIFREAERCRCPRQEALSLMSMAVKNGSIPKAALSEEIQNKI